MFLLGQPQPDLEDLFVSILAPLEDFHLEESGHNALDTGLDVSNLFTDDIDGETRTTPWDMGADEFFTHLYVTGNPAPAGQVALNFVGMPGTAQVGLVIGFNIFDPPLPSANGLWYITNPITTISQEFPKLPRTR